MKLNTLKLTEEKVGKSLEHISTEKIFLNRTTIAYALRSRINKWDLIKLQSFCKGKDTFVGEDINQQIGKDFYQSYIQYRANT